MQQINNEGLDRLRDSSVLNAMITEEPDSSLPEDPTYFLKPGWYDAEASGGGDDDNGSSQRLTNHSLPVLLCL